MIALLRPKPLLYDVFSGAGGATKGYQRAGFRVVVALADALHVTTDYLLGRTTR